MQPGEAADFRMIADQLKRNLQEMPQVYYQGQPEDVAEDFSKIADQFERNLQNIPQNLSRKTRTMEPVVAEDFSKISDQFKRNLQNIPQIYQGKPGRWSRLQPKTSAKLPISLRGIYRKCLKLSRKTRKMEPVEVGNLHQDLDRFMLPNDLPGHCSTAAA